MKVQEPILYPVICFMTGSTPNGGGVWKYILHGSSHGVLRRNLPVMTQVLHFLDFKISPRILRERWRHKPLRESYNGNFGLNYTNSIFADSGGFTLMFDPNLNLSDYDVPANRLAEGIMSLQVDLGADIIASLDYPIPQGLADEEVQRRMGMTLDNALRTARCLAESPKEKKPDLYIPIHGPTPDAMQQFVRDLRERIDAEGLASYVKGLAVGSMVPLRRSNQAGRIVAFVRAARSAMPEDMPLHVFGITGVLTPFLLDAGATSFDTSGYMQYARTLQYLDPTTRRPLHFNELSTYSCTCRICNERNLSDDRAQLEGRTDGQKSEIYAAIALHNLEQDFMLFEEAKDAYESKHLEDFLKTLSSRFSAARRLWVAAHTTEDKVVQRSSPAPIRSHQPEDFDIALRPYQRDPKKTVCLILPCSQEKPYPTSQSFRFVWKHLLEAFDTPTLETIEIVFLSGLYGPVPIAHAYDDAVTTYDFLLHFHDKSGVSLVAKRLGVFLQRYGTDFHAIIAYVTLPAYRKAIELAARTYPALQPVPIEGKKGRLAFYRPQNIQQLISLLKTKLSPEPVSPEEDCRRPDSGVIEEDIIMPALPSKDFAAVGL